MPTTMATFNEKQKTVVNSGATEDLVNATEDLVIIDNPTDEKEGEDIKPVDSISQISNLDHDDDATSVAPTLVTPSPSAARTKRSNSTTSTGTTSPTPTKLTSTGDILFSFGPIDYYFCYLTTRILTRSVVENPTYLAIKNSHWKHVYMHSFSPHGDEFAVYKNTANAIAWMFHQENKSSITYRSLRDWLVKKLDVQDTADILNSRVVFGEGASFFAKNGKGDCIHHDLPTRLSLEIEKRRLGDGVLPDILSLGADETYFARWPPSHPDSATSSRPFKEAGALWALIPSSPIDDVVSAASFNFADYAYIFLSPIDSTRFVAVQKSGMLQYSILDATGTVRDTFKGYMQLKAKETGATFSLSFTNGVGSKDQEVSYINPETNYEMPDVEGEKKGKGKAKAKEGKEDVDGKGSLSKKKRFSIFGRKGEA